MSVFALIEDKKVSKIIIAEKKDYAIAFFNTTNIVEETSLTGLAWVGTEFIDGKFKPLQIYQSWSWDNDHFKWVPPVPQPSYPSYWDEESLSWVSILTESVEE